MLKYDTLEQANLRLTGSIITYQNHAVLVRGVREDTPGVLKLELDTYPVQTAAGNKSKKSDRILVDQSDPDLNYRLFRFGYCNDDVSRNAYYLSRAGRRQQVQGIAAGTLAGVPNRDIALVYRTGFEDMLFDRYPSPREALDRLKDPEAPWERVGISRDFAVGVDTDFAKLHKLFYRGTAVGVAMGEAAFSLANDYKFLAEVTKEQNIPFTLE